MASLANFEGCCALFPFPAAAVPLRSLEEQDFFDDGRSVGHEELVFLDMNGGENQTKDFTNSREVLSKGLNSMKKVGPANLS